MSNFDRVTQGLKIVQGALGPFVHRELSGRFGGKWWTEGVLPALSEVRWAELPATGTSKDLVLKLDVADLALIIIQQWALFAPKLHRDVRTYAHELISIRNTWAHHGAGDMSEDDAWRALDTMTRLLEYVQPGQHARRRRWPRPSARRPTGPRLLPPQPSRRQPITPRPPLPQGARGSQAPPLPSPAHRERGWG